ncbi:MAG: serine/threonine-protein kinase [Nannocystaceae bacterium]|nr:serine/threonine protein kinase [bacterium]
MIVADYEGLEQIGAGAFGVTYKATHRTSGQVVALKKLELAGLPEWKPVERFEREAKVLRSLHHRGVVRFVDAFEHAGEGDHAFYIAFEYVHGQTLAERIEAGHRWDEASAVRLLESLLEALEYLHGLSPPVVHRDIKPGNIMLTEGDRPVLIDFGSVADVSPRTDGALTIAGTVGYMAPEQAMGTADSRSDLYGLGATMVHALTHVHPSEFPRDGLDIVLDERTGCSAHVQAVLARMLAPDPNDRFASATAAREALTAPTEDAASAAKALAPREAKSPAPAQTTALASTPRPRSPAVDDVFTMRRALSEKGPGVVLVPLVLSLLLSTISTVVAPGSLVYLGSLLLIPAFVLGSIARTSGQAKQLYTRGVAVEGRVTGVHTSRESTRVTYAYQADGHPYDGALGTSDMLAVRGLEDGSPITVFHHPENPAISVGVLPKELEKLTA